MNANDIKFHPSALGEIMTGVAKGWSVGDSITCKRYLIKLYRQIIYGREYRYSTKYTEKGVAMEEDGITLLSRVHKEHYEKNKIRLVNDFFDGEPDIIAENGTLDIKCSWSLDTFPDDRVDKIDPDYEFQGIGYMDLTGKAKHTVAYCLVNAPGNLLQREKEMLFYKMNCPDTDDPHYLDCLKELERNMIFDLPAFLKANPNTDLEYGKAWLYDIPASERVVTFTINRDAEKLQKVKDRITECRDWMNAHLFKVNPSVAA